MFPDGVIMVGLEVLLNCLCRQLELRGRLADISDTGHYWKFARSFLPGLFTFNHDLNTAAGYRLICNEVNLFIFILK